MFASFVPLKKKFWSRYFCAVEFINLLKKYFNYLKKHQGSCHQNYVYVIKYINRQIRYSICNTYVNVMSAYIEPTLNRSY